MFFENEAIYEKGITWKNCIFNSLLESNMKPNKKQRQLTRGTTLAQNNFMIELH